MKSYIFKAGCDGDFIGFSVRNSLFRDILSKTARIWQFSLCNHRKVSIGRSSQIASQIFHSRFHSWESALGFKACDLLAIVGNRQQRFGPCKKSFQRRFLLQETRRFVVPSQRERLLECSDRELVAHNPRQAEADEDLNDRVSTITEKLQAKLTLNKGNMWEKS
jgi:hypothetical protein